MRTSIGGRPRNATGLGRPRLLALLSQARPPAPALVVAPAGYGKTTLLAQCAAAHPGPVAWYTADSADGAGGLVLPRLCGAVRAAAGLPPTRDEHLGRLFADLVQATRDTVLLVIDNYEALAGTPAEDLVERTALAGPATLRVVVGSRRMPSLDPVRHEVASGIALVDADALRLRTWEVAQLLRVVHGQPLPAEEVAELTARTGGWPAAIQTYLLATRDRSPAERRRAVAELAGGSPVLRRYLDATLQAARADRAFLLRTSVFDVLTGARCDRLLGATGSAAVLTRLHAAGALPLTGDGDAYRCPEVLREHLHTMLAEEFGPEAARGWHRRAGDLLAAEGEHLAAVRAYARAGDWQLARRHLGQAGPAVADEPDPWWARPLAAPPPLAAAPAFPAAAPVGPAAAVPVGSAPAVPAFSPLVRLAADEPWLIYRDGLGLQRAGRIEAALERFRRAEVRFADTDGARRCREQRALTRVWLPDADPPLEHWTAWLRAVLRRQPGAVAAAADLPAGPAGTLVRLAALVLSGDLQEAQRLAPREVTGDSLAGVALHLLTVCLRLMLADRDGPEAHAESVELDLIAGAAEELGHPWLARIAIAARALGRRDADADEARAIAAECAALGDRWGEVLCMIFVCTHDLRAWQSRPAELERLVRGCREVGAGVLEAWVQALYAVVAAAQDLPDAELEAHRADSLARSVGVPGAEVAAGAALARIGRRPVDDVRGLAGSAGMPEKSVRTWVGRPWRDPALTPPAVGVWCFGGFRMEFDGRPVDLTGVRPRARTALRLLAMRADQHVHREVLLEALWPGMPAAAATRNLQVSISTLRKLLQPHAQITRSGDAYALSLPAGGYADTLAFAAADRRWRESRQAGDPTTVVAALGELLAAYGGELLPEDGPVEWVSEERERYRRRAASAASELAGLELGRGNARDAIVAAEQCVAIDAYHDTGWRHLLAAYEAIGDVAAGAAARRRYSEVLMSLGVPATFDRRAVVPSQRPAPSARTRSAR